MARVIRAPDSARVVPARLFDAKMEAEQIVSNAERQAAALVRAAHEARDEMAKAALHAATEKAHADVATALVRIAELRATAAADARQEIGELAIAVAQKILTAQLSLEPERIRDITSAVIERAERANAVRVCVHPADAFLLRDHATMRGVTVIEDPAIERGGCIVYTEHGVYDARISVQLDAFAQALRAR